MRLCFLIFAGSCLSITSCQNGNITNNKNINKSRIEEKSTSAPPRSRLDDNGTQILLAMLNHYYRLKNALVAANVVKADSAATQLIMITDSLRADTKNANNASLIKPYTDTLIAQNKNLLSYKDESSEHQRIIFAGISSAMYGLLKAVDLKNMQIYHEYCPMAMNEKGAYWLSDESEIKNPYFGKKMLECGEVTDSLK